MIKGLTASTMIDMLDSRINILRTRGEMMNMGIINKLERKKRKIMRELGMPTLVSPGDKVDI